MCPLQSSLVRPRTCTYCNNRMSTRATSPVDTPPACIVDVTCPIHGAYRFIELLTPNYSFFPISSGQCLICGNPLTPSQEWLDSHKQEYKDGTTEETYACPHCNANHIITLNWRI